MESTLGSVNGKPMRAAVVATALGGLIIALITKTHWQHFLEGRSLSHRRRIFRLPAVALSSIVLTLGVPGCAGPEPTQAPYYLPRHPDAAATPLGLGQGVLEGRGRCFYVGRFLLIWPDDYFVTERDGIAVIEGDGWRISPGDHIEFGGGSYDRASDLPNGAAEATGVPCSGPYNWVSEIRDVIPPRNVDGSGPPG
jgi:hypothetical protein